LLYRFNGSYLTSESFRDFNNRDRVFIAPKLTWRPNDRFEANLELEKRHDNYLDDFGIPIAGNRPAPVRNSLWTGDPAFKSSSDNTLIAADWSFNFNDDWKIKHKFQWDETDNTFGNLFPNQKVTAADTVRRVAILGTSNRRSYTTSLDLTGKFETLGMKHNVLLGGDYFFWNQDAPDNKRIFPFMGYIPRMNIYNPQYGNIDWAGIDSVPANLTWRSRDEWFGLYFQDQITLWDKLHILGGGRYDMAGYGGYGGDTWEATQAGFSMRHEDKFSPRVGVVYQPWEWLSLFGNYVESFGTNNGRSVSGSNFPPQQSEQHEVGFKTEFFDKKLSSTVSFYELKKTNILVTDLTALIPNTQVAIGEARSRGIEVDVKGQVTDNLNLIATYAYTDVRVTKDNTVANGGYLGNRLQGVPEHQASLWGTYQFTEKFKAGLGGVLVGTRQGDAANSYQLPGYGRLDAMAAYIQPIGKTRLTAQININNLLDKEYFTGSTSWLPTANVGAPISAMGSLKLEY
jgi:iron complex outermembrane receptor protein